MWFWRGLILGSPVGVGKRCDNCRVDGEFHEGIECCWFGASKADAMTFRAFQIADHAFNCVEVTGRCSLGILR